MATIIHPADATRRHGPEAYANLACLSNRFFQPFNVSLSEPAAVRYWCRRFSTTPEQLFDAVTKVGSNPAILQLHLRALNRARDS